MIKLNVKEMACGGCAKSVTDAVLALDSGADVKVDLASGAVEVTTSSSAEAVCAAIEEAGFPAQVA